MCDARVLRLMMLVVVTLTATWGAVAQDASPTSPVSPIGSDADLAPDSPLPQIPITMLSFLSSGVPDTETLKVSKEQRQEIATWMTSYHAQRRPYDAIRGELTQHKLLSHRLQRALDEALFEIEVKARGDAQRLLTAEQRAKLRQMKRQEITQQNAMPQRMLLTDHFGGPSISECLANDDLLSVLLKLDLQQRLMLTDEQWLRIDAARKEAYRAAPALIQAAKESDLTVFEPSENMPSVQQRLEQLKTESLEILTQEQRFKFEALMKDRQEKQPTAGKVPGAPVKILYRLPHGKVVVLSAQTINGVTTCRVILHNIFVEPEIIRMVDVTPAQRNDISRLVADCQTSIQDMVIQQKNEEVASLNDRKQKFRELILTHNRGFQARLADVLTPEQNALVAQAKWGSMGFQALLTPEVSTQLQLTAEQKTAIEAELRKPAPQMKFPTSGNFEEFKKNSDEWSKKSREHSEAMIANIWAQLTPEQVEKYEKLTGNKRPKPAVKGPEGK